MNEILIVAQWMTKVKRSQITLHKPSSDWPKLLKGHFQNAKIYLKEIGREDIRTWCVTECFPLFDANDVFLWCLREPAACCELQMKAEHSGAHWDVPIQSHLAMKLAVRFISNITKVTVIGICTKCYI